MVRHVLFWNLTDQAKAQEEAVYAAMEESCARMKAGVPSLKVCQIERAQTAGSTHDFLFYCEFESLEDLAAFTVHPLHQAHKELTKNWVKDRAMVDTVPPSVEK
jgi:antibiotic biosynthesis monooxygenase (ABM) superfamily enzyme